MTSPRPSDHERGRAAGQARQSGRSLSFTAGVGKGGQRLVVVPESELAVVFAAGACNEERVGATQIASFRPVVASPGSMLEGVTA